MNRLILFLLLLNSVVAFSNEPLKEASVDSVKEPLKVAMFDKLPFAYKEGGEMKGFHYAVAKGIAGRMGVPLEVTLVPIRRAIELLRQGAVEIVIMTDQTTFADMKTRKSFLKNGNTFIYTRADHKSIQSKQDLAGPICRLAGGCTDLDDVKAIHWSDLKSYEQCLDVLLLGRVEGVCGSVAFRAVLHKRKIASEQIQQYAVSEKPVWVHALPAMSEKRWKEIDAAVQALVKNGSIDEWAQKYLNP